MTDVRFYHLEKLNLEKALPVLLEDILESNQRVLLVGQSIERLSSIDSFLWTYKENSWLPHGLLNEKYSESQPILLSTNQFALNEARVMVLVDGVSIDQPEKFSCIFDMFDGNDDLMLQAARGRWTECKKKGLKLTYWQENGNQSWQQRG